MGDNYLLYGLTNFCRIRVYEYDYEKKQYKHLWNTYSKHLSSCCKFFALTQMKMVNGADFQFFVLQNGNDLGKVTIDMSNPKGQTLKVPCEKVFH
jgi:hypothetical protein